MICLRCESEDFAPKAAAVIEQEFKGERLEVLCPALACKNCGYVAMDLNQIEELRRRTADAYRQKMGLLTSHQILLIRKSLAMTQAEFAKFLGVGEASVKRWETWQVQENSLDQLMRAKYRLHLWEEEKRKTLKAIWFTGAEDSATTTTSPATQWPPPAPQHPGAGLFGQSQSSAPGAGALGNQQTVPFRGQAPPLVTETAVFGSAPSFELRYSLSQTMPCQEIYCF